MFTPEFYTRGLTQFDRLYDNLNSSNPEIASFLIKPSALVDTFK
jgi:hypothetical protein